MTLIKSISGIRGTIGGTKGDNLTPIDIVECASGYGQYIRKKDGPNKVVVGRDGRITGAHVSALVVNTLMMMGIDVVDLGLSTTPTVEIAVPLEDAGGGIILTASHNPKQWNALKFLTDSGEFISKETGEQILHYIAETDIKYADVDDLGKYEIADQYISVHIDQILELDIISPALIKSKSFKVVVDCINSTGALLIPPLLDKLNVRYTLINDNISGDFAHNPEPLPKHMSQLSSAVIDYQADLGICVDPDVDRLAFMCEDGVAFGEEYTLVSAADFVLSKTGGDTVSNLSSTRALSDVTERYGYQYHASAVGEVNVVNLMKASGAVIGGEGNGGVILPALHYGRDAAVGIAIMLNLLAEKNITLSKLKKSYPEYEIIKNKIDLTPEIDIDRLLYTVGKALPNEKQNTVDGLKIDFDKGWVHLRKSNTEPIIRVYAESQNRESADILVNRVMNIVNQNI